MTKISYNTIKKNKTLDDFWQEESESDSESNSKSDE